MSASRWLAVLVLISGAALGAGCSGEESEREDVRPTPPPVPLPVPQDPVREFEEATVPPPREYGDSHLRRAAAREGLFKDLPKGSPENLAALLEAFKEALAAASEKPGRMGSGPAGESYAPSTAEFVVVECALRIRKAKGGMSPEEIAKAWRAAGFEGREVEFQTYREVTVKAFGTGFALVIERHPDKIVVPE